MNVTYNLFENSDHEIDFATPKTLGTILEALHFGNFKH